MSPDDRDPHERFFKGTREGFALVRDTAKWRDPPVASLLNKIRKRVLQGGFPVNMEVEPLCFDAVAESMELAKRETVPELSKEEEEQRQMRLNLLRRLQISEILRHMVIRPSQVHNPSSTLTKMAERS